MQGTGPGRPREKDERAAEGVEETEGGLLEGSVLIA